MTHGQKYTAETDPDGVGCLLYILFTITILIFYPLKWLWEKILASTHIHETKGE